jgi:mannose-6-phosphate isomerase-like protein (cupin superfamily)
MEIKSYESGLQFHDAQTHKGAELIGEKNGAKNGFCLGISYYFAEEFGHPGIHDDQEGFYILEGTGQAKIGEEVFKIFPGVSFIAHAGVLHEIIKDAQSVPVKVLWSHGAL